MHKYPQRTRSRFILPADVGTITASSVKFVFRHRSAGSLKAQPLSSWGRTQSGLTCLLYFDFLVREREQKCTIERAEVKLDFAPSDGTQLQIFHVRPKNEFRAPSSQLRNLRTWSMGPVLDTPVGGGNIGTIGGEQEYQGVPDWRFFCDRFDSSVAWSWIRGRYYKDSRGVPEMVVGLAATDHPQKPFSGDVTMSIKPRRFWRRPSSKVFSMDFHPPCPQDYDLSILLSTFCETRWEPIQTQE
jgi:hypothetical protein